MGRKETLQFYTVKCKLKSVTRNSLIRRKVAENIMVNKFPLHIHL